MWFFFACERVRHGFQRRLVRDRWEDIKGGLIETVDADYGVFEGTTFKAGECIVRKGESPTHIYIIQSGRVELRIADGAVDLRKREFTVGDHFGEVAMLSMINNTASFFAAEDCQLITFSRRGNGQSSDILVS